MPLMIIFRSPVSNEGRNKTRRLFIRLHLTDSSVELGFNPGLRFSSNFSSEIVEGDHWQSTFWLSGFRPCCAIRDLNLREEKLKCRLPGPPLTISEGKLLLQIYLFIPGLVPFFD